MAANGIQDKLAFKLMVSIVELVRNSGVSRQEAVAAIRATEAMVTEMELSERPTFVHFNRKSGAEYDPAVAVPNLANHPNSVNVQKAAVSFAVFHHREPRHCESPFAQLIMVFSCQYLLMELLVLREVYRRAQSSAA